MRAFLKFIILVGGVAVASAEEPMPAKSKAKAPPPALGLLDGLRTGQLAAKAEGTGGPKLRVTVANQSGRALRVILPPGLIASGATGQFGGGFGGGMGGMGGGMGGMGGMGGGMMGGMGGMGGGMGGMGGGMGGMGGGMGGMGGGGMVQLVTPPMMGMQYILPIFVFLIEPGTWDLSSMSMMGGMGGMGGGMGGMGGGMMGGMGGMGGGMGGMGMGGMFSVGTGGFRSIPPTGLPHADLQPGQVRELNSRLIALDAPREDGRYALPAKGEPLTLGGFEQVGGKPQVEAALVRLAESKAPQGIAQLAVWNLSAGQDWKSLERISKGWANAQEVAIARDFADAIRSGRELPKQDSAALYVDVAEGPQELVDELREVFGKNLILGLPTRVGVPEKPEGPAVSCEIRVDRVGQVATVAVKSSNGRLDGWEPLGKFTLDLTQAIEGKVEPLKAPLVADRFAEGLLNRLVRVQVTKKARTDNTKAIFLIQVDNASPLILNGIALTGKAEGKGQKVGAIAGLNVGPRRSFTIPTLFNNYKALGLKEGARILAADLSGL